MAKRRKKLPPNAYRVHLNMEAPRIGCGWRMVQLISTGRKWARLRELATARTARLPARVWADIERSAIRLT